MKFVYGVFPDRKPAERALTQLHERTENRPGVPEDLEHGISTASIHEYDIRNNDLPRSANFALRSALVGGALVGGALGLFLGLLMAGAFAGIGGPATIIGSEPWHVVGVALAAAVFGAIAAGIAGSAGTRAKVRKLREQLAEGKVLVTLEVPRRKAKAISRSFSELGAVQAGAM
jgi:hypothetical protein